MEGQSTLANIGDRVLNLGTTSCGLVVAYGNDKVAAYHWPFMSDTAEYHTEFKNVVGRLGANPRFIQVVTNDFPNTKDADKYKAVVVKIKNTWKVPTTYYIHPGQVRGVDPFVTLRQNGVESIVHPIKEVELPKS